MNRRKAFTLVELLVVISIIALLISILLPSLKQARDQAKQVKCANNQRNISIGITQYTTENNDYHHATWANNALRYRELFGRRYALKPYSVDSFGNPQANEVYWATIVDQYSMDLKDISHYYEPTKGMGQMKSLPCWENTKCPTAKYTIDSFRRVGGSGAILPHDPYTLYSSYCFNGVTPGFDSIPDSGTATFFEKKDGKRVPTQLTRIKFPSNLIIYHDGSEVMMDGNGDTLLQLDQGAWDDYKPQWINEYFRHPGGCVITWTDGHISTMSRKGAEEERKKLTRTYGDTHHVRLKWYTAQ